jgi:predicted DNA-binding transcriptional regulator AlpA
LSEHHLDRRAGELIAAGAGDSDDMLDTKRVAAWLGMSVITLEIWRSKGKGPPFIKLTPRMVRYRRKDVLYWLAKRTCVSTAD